MTSFAAERLKSAPWLAIFTLDVPITSSKPCLRSIAGDAPASPSSWMTVPLFASLPMT
jgi:hypothetical protein